MSIFWEGQTKDYKTKYSAEAETYKELYEVIQNKYGYDNIIDKKVAERIFSAKDDNTLDESDYKSLLENSKLYYQYFCEMPSFEEFKEELLEYETDFKFTEGELHKIYNKMTENRVSDISELAFFSSKVKAIEWLNDDDFDTLYDILASQPDMTFNEVINQEFDNDERFTVLAEDKLMFMYE